MAQKCCVTIPMQLSSVIFWNSFFFFQATEEVHLPLLFLRGYVRDDDNMEFSSLCFPFGTGQLPGDGL